MTVNELIQLPGVGRKTANVITSVIDQQPNMAVDTHVFRVSAGWDLLQEQKRRFRQSNNYLNIYLKTLCIKPPLAHTSWALYMPGQEPKMQ
jgi:endonuclease III